MNTNNNNNNEANHLRRIIADQIQTIEALERRCEDLENAQKDLKQANEINDWFYFYARFILDNNTPLDKSATNYADKETKDLNYAF